MRFRIITEMTFVIGLTATGAAPPVQPPVPADARAARFADARALHERLGMDTGGLAGESHVWATRAPGWLHDSATAAAAFDREIETGPGAVDALLGKAYLLTWAARDVDAAALLARAALAAPDRADVHLARARHATLTGQLADATRHVDRTLALAPAHAEALALRRIIDERRHHASLPARVVRLLTPHS